MLLSVGRIADGLSCGDYLRLRFMRPRRRIDRVDRVNRPLTAARRPQLASNFVFNSFGKAIPVRTSHQLPLVVREGHTSDRATCKFGVPR